jgi:ribosomal protein S13
MFTQDLEDDESITKLKVDKTTKLNKLTKDQIKLVYATVGATGLVESDLKQILNEMGYTSIKDCKGDECNKILDSLKALAKSRKENN